MLIMHVNETEQSLETAYGMYHPLAMFSVAIEFNSPTLYLSSLTKHECEDNTTREPVETSFVLPILHFLSSRFYAFTLFNSHGF